MYANIWFNWNKNEIHLWQYKDGKREHLIEPYNPYCFVYDKSGDYKDLYGQACRKKTFDSYHDQREFVKNWKTLEGDIQPDSRYLIDRFYTQDLISNLPEYHIHIIDIETNAENGFPVATKKENCVYSICVFSTKDHKYTTFTTVPYTGKLKFDVVLCKDETELFQKYFKFHRDDHPDVITGWNVSGFDVPYILDRAEYLLGENFAKKYSPVGDVQKKTWAGGGETDVEIGGITVLDYMVLYKKFAVNQRESYSLNYISKIELDNEKVHYDGTLDDLRRDNPNRYLEYNLKDVMLVKKLHEKFDFIGLCQVTAYFSKVPLNKTDSSIRKFDNYLLSLLKPMKIVLPTHTRGDKKEIPGGYVSEPMRGYYKYVGSYDFTALYPHIIFALNLSPETFIGKVQDANGIDFVDIDYAQIKASNSSFRFLGKSWSGGDLCSYIDSEKLIISANGVVCNSNFGFIPKVVKGIFDKRKEFKKVKISEERLYEETKDVAHKNNALKYDLYQIAVKTLANACYGIMANENFRLFNPDFASAITLTGQKIIKYTIMNCNTFFKKNFKAEGDVVIAADTDSVYINFEPVMKHFGIVDNSKFPDIMNKLDEKAMKPFFAKFLTEFSNNLLRNEKNWFDLKQEATAIGGIFIQKKKYALYVIAMEGVAYDKPKVKVKGLEIVRSSTPSFCRDKIKEVVEAMFVDMNKDRIVERIREINDQFKSQPLDTISFPRGVSDYSSYVSGGALLASPPIHVRASYHYNRLVKEKQLEGKYTLIKNGEKIKFIYMMEAPKYKENVIAFVDSFPEEFGLKEYIDFETQFEKSFMSPIQTLSEAVGWGKIDLNVSNIAELF